MIEAVNPPVPLLAVVEHGAGVVLHVMPSRGARCCFRVRLGLCGTTMALGQSPQATLVTGPQGAAHVGGTLDETGGVLCCKDGGSQFDQGRIGRSVMLRKFQAIIRRHVKGVIAGEPHQQFRLSHIVALRAPYQVTDQFDIVARGQGL